PTGDPQPGLRTGLPPQTRRRRRPLLLPARHRRRDLRSRRRRPARSQRVRGHPHDRAVPTGAAGISQETLIAPYIPGMHTRYMSIKHGLLALLERGPMYGYQLRTAFVESTGGTWPLNIGQVYTTLSRLERDDLVRALPEEEGGQRPYEITAAGRADLA